MDRFALGRRHVRRRIDATTIKSEPFLKADSPTPFVQTPSASSKRRSA
jgi:hypothetical protein